jgi:2-dehydropantoate 2-reductase
MFLEKASREMQERIKIAVVGIGGVGGYFGGKLAHAFQDQAEPLAEIHFVARGQHLETIKRKGLVLKTSGQKEWVCRPRSATDRFEQLPEIDVFVIAVKGYDLDDVSRSLSRKTNKQTVFLPLLNGMDIIERMRRHIRDGVILPACVYLSAFIEEAGVVAHIGNPGRIILGPDSETGYRPDPLLPVFEAASVLYEYRQDALSAIWEKYIFIAGYGLVSARFNKTLDEIHGDEVLRNLLKAMMEEIRQIAVKKSVALPENIVDASIQKAQLFPKGTQTSLQRDVYQNKKKTELDLFGKAILDQAERFNVSTPITRKIYGELIDKISK